jgi:hypothetical protein
MDLLRLGSQHTIRPAIPLALILAFLSFAAVGCGGGDDGNGAGAQVDDPGPVHVHALGVNPKDDALFIATHTGLFRAVPGQARSRRVADRYQDTMGFTVVGPDRFLGSGHPDLTKDPDLPPLLGLIESSDAGNTWEPISLLGEADFHVLEASRKRIYGFDSSGERLMVSIDGGKTWSEVRTPEPLVSLAIDPQNTRHVIASGETGLYESSNEGRRWRRMRGSAGLLGWPTARQLYLLGADGRLRISTGIGEPWRAAGEIGGEPAAFEAQGRRELYAALHDGTIKRSADGGRSWQVRAQP